MITAEDGDRKVTRNCSYFNRFEGKVENEENDIPVDLNDGDGNRDEPSQTFSVMVILLCCVNIRHCVY